MDVQFSKEIKPDFISSVTKNAYRYDGFYIVYIHIYVCICTYVYTLSCTFFILEKRTQIN